MKEIKKILVPIDFSSNSQKLLKDAIYIAGSFKSKLDIVYVVESLYKYSGLSIPHISLDQLEEDLQQSAEKKLEDFLEENVESSNINKAIVLKGEIAEEINNYAKKEDIDLIVMGTHAYKGLEKTLFGSVANQIFHSASCPIMIINPYK